MISMGPSNIRIIPQASALMFSYWFIIPFEGNFKFEDAFSVLGMGKLKCIMTSLC